MAWGIFVLWSGQRLDLYPLHSKLGVLSTGNPSPTIFLPWLFCLCLLTVCGLWHFCRNDSSCDKSPQISISYRFDELHEVGSPDSCLYRKNQPCWEKLRTLTKKWSIIWQLTRMESLSTTPPLYILLHFRSELTMWFWHHLLHSSCKLAIWLQ